VCGIAGLAFAQFNAEGDNSGQGPASAGASRSAAVAGRTEASTSVCARVMSALLQRSTSLLRHRGPDDQSVWIDPSGTVGLGHTRLAIIDLPGGRQPMPNEDETVWVVFNGEIYNHVELRAELERLGHTFRTRSDTEVLVHLYEEHGPEMLQHLVGMFAFAIWDRGRRSLLLARDRLGQKPLYVSAEGPRLAFASELKALVPLLQRPLRWSPEAIYHYLTFQYVPSDLCALEPAQKLQPGEYWLCEPSNEANPDNAAAGEATAEQAGGWRIERRRYWQVPRPEADFDMSFDEAARQLRELLVDATRLRLRSDVPLGVLLSGGIDSSVVVGLMAELGVRPIRTYTVSFAPSGPDERPYAAAVAKRFGTMHHELVVEPPDPAEADRIVRLYDEPFADTSAIPTYLICQLARRHVKVVLTGDGGDESMLGYDRYAHYRRYLRQRPWLRPLMHWSGLRGVAVRLCPAGGRRTWRRRFRTLVTLWDPGPAEVYERWLAIFTESAKERLCRQEFAERAASRAGRSIDRIIRGLQAYYCGDWPAAAAAFDMATYLPDAVLTKVDRASMTHGLECRSPFLDHRVIEFLAAVPPGWKCDKRRGSKWLLRHACRDLLPREVFERPKAGFGSPVGLWFRTAWSGLLEHGCMPNRTLQQWVRPGAVKELITEHSRGEVDHTYRLWTLYCLNRAAEQAEVEGWVER